MVISFNITKVETSHSNEIQKGNSNFYDWVIDRMTVRKAVQQYVPTKFHLGYKKNKATNDNLGIVFKATIKRKNKLMGCRYYMLSKLWLSGRFPNA